MMIPELGSIAFTIQAHNTLRRQLHTDTVAMSDHHVVGIHKMSKKKLAELMTSWGESVDEKMTRDELVTLVQQRNPTKVRDPMTEYNHMKKADLAAALEAHQLQVTVSDTRGTMLLRLREYFELNQMKSEESLVGFGPHKEKTYQELMKKEPEYCEWVLHMMEESKADGNAKLRSLAGFLLANADGGEKERLKCGACGKKGHTVIRCPVASAEMKEMYKANMTSSRSTATAKVKGEDSSAGEQADQQMKRNAPTPTPNGASSSSGQSQMPRPWPTPTGVDVKSMTPEQVQQLEAEIAKVKGETASNGSWTHAG